LHNKKVEKKFIGDGRGVRFHHIRTALHPSATPLTSVVFHKFLLANPVTLKLLPVHFKRITVLQVLMHSGVARNGTFLKNDERQSNENI